MAVRRILGPARQAARRREDPRPGEREVAARVEAEGDLRVER